MRSISTRARISATSFVNSYDFGDFKGKPERLMERWFDLHLYLANWGSRRLMIRFPKRLVDQSRLNEFLDEVDSVGLAESGDNLILDIDFNELPLEEEWDDGTEWLSSLSQLRADVLAGDLRLFYLLWLTAAGNEFVEADVLEPLPGIGPMTAALEAFARFFALNADLVAAAAECPVEAEADASRSAEAAGRIIAGLSDEEKTEFLTRLFDGEPHLSLELRSLVRERLSAVTASPQPGRRTAGELRARAEVIRAAREKAEVERRAATKKREAETAERARRVRLDKLAKRGENAWREIETEIERRNAASYDQAVSLLADLKSIAGENGTSEEFNRRLDEIRARHDRKGRFLERLAILG